MVRYRDPLADGDPLADFFLKGFTAVFPEYFYTVFSFVFSVKKKQKKFFSIFFTLKSLLLINCF